MLKTAAKPIDVQDLQFKLQCRLNIFDKQEGNLSKTCKSLLASASRFGLVFVGCASAKLKVLGFESIESNSSTEATKAYPRREINLISEPHHISVNCDHTILAVIVLKDNSPSALFYDVLSFYKENVVLLNEVRLTSTPGLEVLQANWHPTLNNVFTECKSDGTLGIYELKDKSMDVKKLPAESKACCFCWSPKGKQIAVGSQNGKIIHYKPDLKAVKSIDAPPFDKPHSILSLQWISNYQFVGVFKMSNESDPECCVVLIDAPKTGNPTFTNFYDICYSNGNFRAPQFYMIAEQQWNILLVASANSMEVGVLSNTGEIWTQWILPDSARAELPLDENKDETFPIGMTIDISSDKPVLWGESYLQPAPSLILLSHEGVLCCFKMVNLKEGAPSVNSPAEKVADMSGLRHFVTPAPEPVATAQEVPNVQEATVPKKDATPSNVATPVPTNPPSIFSLPSSTPTSAPTVQPLSQGQQTPTTPLSIFKSPAPRPQVPSLPTNLFGSQISITPVKSKETAPPTTAASVGASLLSNILSEGSSGQKKDVTPASMASMPFSNLLSGSLAAQTTITPIGKQLGTTPGVSVGSGTGNRLSGSGQLQAGGLQGSSFGVSSISGSAPMQASKNPVGSGAAPQNVQFGLQRAETKPNVLSSVPNARQPPALVRIDKNAEEKENAEIQNMLTKMIQMECLALEKEIKDLLIQGQHLKIPLKYDEMGQIVQNTDDINEFLKELVETCEIQSSEVHILKQNTIQSWAWVEEARSRYKESQDQELNILLKSKPLDSVSEKHLSTLKQMKYYLDSQLKQSHKALDDQWDKFQDYCRKNNRIQLPTMEAIFQTMVKQNAILQKHNYILKDISSQIKGKQKASNNAALFNPQDKKDNLEVSFQNLKLEPENIYHIYYQKVLNRVKSVPPNKTNQLRRILHNRDVPHVMAKSQLSTSALNSSLRTSLQLSTSLKTPIGKKDNSQLYQSTPLNLTPESAPQIASTPLSAFAATSNLAAKPQLTRFGSDSQYTVPSSMPTTLSGDKQSGVPQSQNSLFKTSTMNTNEKVGYNAFSNFGLSQEANQNMFGSNRNATTSSSLSNSFSASTNSQSQKFTVAEPAVATSKQFVPLNPTSNVTTSTTPQNIKSTNVFGPSISSSTGSTQPGASNKLFSFASSSSQSKEVPISTAVTSTTVGFSTSVGSTLPSVPLNTFASSFLGSATNGGSGFGKTAFGGTAGLFASSSNTAFGSDSSSNKDNRVASSTQSSAQATSGFTFGSPAPSDAAVSSSGVSEIVSSETSNEAVPVTAASVFRLSTTSSKPSFGSNLVSGSGSKPAVTIFSVPTSDEVSTTSSVSTSSTSGGLNAASSTFQFGSSVTSSDSVSTTTSSLFGLSLKKEESSADNKPTVSSSGEVLSSKTVSGSSVTNTSKVSSSTTSIFGTAATIFGSNVTSSGQSLGTFSAFGSSSGVSSTTSGEVSITSKSIFNTVSASSSSLFGVSSTTGESASSTAKSIFSGSGTSTVPDTTNNSLSITSKSLFGAAVSSSGAPTETADAKYDTAPTSTTSMAASSNVGTISSSVPSIFGTASSSSLGASAKSMFGASATSSGTVPSSPSGLGTPATTSGTTPSTAPSIFGASVTSSGTTASTSQSVFGASATSSPAASKSIFGTSATSSEATSSGPKSIFGASATSTAALPSSSTSIFGASAMSSVAAPSSSTSIFGASGTNSGAAPSATKSIFGASTTSSGATPPTSTSMFGASASTSGTASSTSIFGASATSSGTASTASIFRASATASPLSPTTKSIFENAVSSTTKTTTPTVNSQPSPFGNASSTGSIFGNGATASSPFGTGKSVFGSANTAASPFGSSAPVSSSPFSATPFANATSSNSVFGQATSTVSPFNTASGATSPFGGTAAATAQSPFGGTSSTAESPFGSATPSVCSPFGSQGFGTGFNANTTVQSSPFGQVSTSSNVFGSSNATSENASSPFGQSSGSMFGSFGSTSTKPAEGSFGFGNLNMGTASQSVFSKPNESKSPFGSANFNPTTSSGSLFGSSSFGNNNGNSVFRQSAFGGSSVFSNSQQSGPFSGGSGSIAQSGFGIQTPQKPPAFGASPTFGGTPAFGSAPTFGGAPAFGSTPTFGSPNQVFGSASPSQAGSAFGSTNTQQSSGFGSFASQNSLGFGQQPNNPAANSTQGSGFGSFASQNTIGFGNLAQQTNNAQNAPFSGASSFSSWR